MSLSTQLAIAAFAVAVVCFAIVIGKVLKANDRPSPVHRPSPPIHPTKD